MKKTIIITACIIIIGVILYMLLTEAGIALNPISGNSLKNRALSHFSEKYDVPKNKIKVLHNNLFDKNQKCFGGCGDSTLDIQYNGNEYRIRYEIYYDTFTDNYQVEEIKRDLLDYLQEQMPYASNISMDEKDFTYSRNPDKYEGDIILYINNFLPYSYESVDGEYDVNEEEKNLFINVWIKAENVEEAKEKYEMYGTKTVQVLDSIQAFKRIKIANSEDTQNMYSYYYLEENVNNGQFVDNTKKY